MAEVERWLTARRIGLSDLAMLIFDAMHDPDIALTKERANQLMASLITTFATGACLFVASAVARQTGYPIAAFRRPDGHLIHAAVVDPTSMSACDVLGARPLPELRKELNEAVSSNLTLAAELPIGADDMNDQQQQIYLEFARGLPWMPVADLQWKSNFPQWSRQAFLLADAFSHR